MSATAKINVSQTVDVTGVPTTLNTSLAGRAA